MRFGLCPAGAAYFNATTEAFYRTLEVSIVPDKPADDRLDEYIGRVVDAAPPLTADQRDRLAQLQRPVARDGRPACRQADRKQGSE